MELAATNAAAVLATFCGCCTYGNTITVSSISCVFSNPLQISNLESLYKLDVLDLHSNEIQVIEGLQSLQELRVLNLAGNRIRYDASAFQFGATPDSSCSLTIMFPPAMYLVSFWEGSLSGWKLGGVHHTEVLRNRPWPKSQASRARCFGVLRCVVHNFADISLFAQEVHGLNDSFEARTNPRLRLTFYPRWSRLQNTSGGLTNTCCDRVRSAGFTSRVMLITSFAQVSTMREKTCIYIALFSRSIG